MDLMVLPCYAEVLTYGKAIKNIDNVEINVEIDFNSSFFNSSFF